jgi:hypothetical protein
MRQNFIKVRIKKAPEEYKKPPGAFTSAVLRDLL